jgi:hypothetical protein
VEGVRVRVFDPDGSGGRVVDGVGDGDGSVPMYSQQLL